MQFDRKRVLARCASLIVVASAAAFLASCTSTSQKSMVSKPRSKEYFAETEYGVKASPRVTNKRSRLPRGGGRDQVGKPYKVKGKWYYPKEDKRYAKVGAASWYGDAFHGRLTANGEIYDMTHLTAAHPTMPLPSYARVTNTKNGASVIVRVNDRGPFAHDRVIDLSKRAAEMLDYTHAGVAKVKVEYVGRAPLHGQDDQYLMASYRPGRGDAPDRRDPDVGLPSGVMIAMGGPTPSGQRPATLAAFPGALSTVSAGVAMPSREPARPVLEPVVASAGDAPAGDLVLPVAGPIIPERPSLDIVIAAAPIEPRLLGYADMRVARAAEAVEAFAKGGLASGDVIASWRKRTGTGAARTGSGAFIAAGTFATRAEAERLAAALSAAGAATIVADGDAWSVELRAGAGTSTDGLLRSAWDRGAPDAFLVRE